MDTQNRTQREIKLRAWDKKHKRMVNLDTPTAFCESGYDEIDYIAFSEGDARYVDSNQVVWAEQYELMQYTGLKDRHGVEIYEGDIVREYDDYDGEPAIIDWNTDDACFRINYDGESDGFYNIGSTMIEVIGNIYENPELSEAN